jgi:dolichol-phosphate mannosyltransferase
MVNLAADGMLSFSKVPLRLAPLLGLLAMGLALVMAVGTLVCWLSSSTTVDLGGTAVLASLYFLGGAILVSLGIVGEYVGRIYDQVKGRPLYLVKDQFPPAQRIAQVDSNQPPAKPYARRSEEGQTAA